MGLHTDDRPVTACVSLGRPMGTVEAPFSRTRAQSLRGPAAALGGSLPGGDPICSCDRLPVGKITKVLPVVQHLLAAIRRLDAVRRIPDPLADSAGRTRRPGRDRLERSRRGRLVREGEKGGDGVGNTKRGKGCKVVDLVDSQDAPLAVHLAAANHAEVKLIEPEGT
jgi:hypothetical protein